MNVEKHEISFYAKIKKYSNVYFDISPTNRVFGNNTINTLPVYKCFAGSS